LREPISHPACQRHPQRLKHTNNYFRWPVGTLDRRLVNHVIHDLRVDEVHERVMVAKQIDHNVFSDARS
jgi:hypothetical protein